MAGAPCLAAQPFSRSSRTEREGVEAALAGGRALGSDQCPPEPDGSGTHLRRRNVEEEVKEEARGYVLGLNFPRELEDSFALAGLLVERMRQPLRSAARTARLAGPAEAGIGAYRVDRVAEERGNLRRCLTIERVTFFTHPNSGYE